MNSDSQIIELLKAMHEDLEAVRKHTARLVRDSLRQDLERLARTPERQGVWQLCDGTLSTEDIAKNVGLSIRAVQYIIQEYERAGLLFSMKRGFPKRVEEFDVIPSNWKPYKKPALAKEEPQAHQEEVKENDEGQ